MFKREILFDRFGFIVVFVISIGLFVLGSLLQTSHVGNPNLVVLLKMPIFTSLVFLGLKVLYFRLFNEHAVDTFWSMDMNLMKDGIFNFLFFFFSIIIPVLIVYYFLK